jgi:hypothetical protein
MKVKEFTDGGVVHHLAVRMSLLRLPLRQIACKYLRQIIIKTTIVLWNTLYMDAVLDQLRAEGYSVRLEDEARLSPFVHEHINMLGRYSFAVPEAVARGELRPLRNASEW